MVPAFGSGVSSDVQVSPQQFSVDKVIPQESAVTITAASTGSTPASGLNGIFSNVGHGLENLFSSDSGGASMVAGTADQSTAASIDPSANIGKFILFVAVAVGLFYWVNR